MILVEADTSDEWDSSTGWRTLAERAVKSAIGASPHRTLLDARCAIEVSVRLTDDAEVRQLNSAYRGKDKATNVLSFPMLDPAELEAIDPASEGETLLGDIVLARGTCAAEADARGISVEDHAAHLLVHGALHLLGYDHEMGEDEAMAMERLERAALASLGIADPYSSETRFEGQKLG